MSHDESDRNGPRLLCRTFNGTKGAQFTRWRADMLDAAEGKGDEDASWAMCYLGTDPQAGLTAKQVGVACTTTLG